MDFPLLPSPWMTDTRVPRNCGGAKAILKELIGRSL